MKELKLHELKVKRLEAQINTIEHQLDDWLEKDKDKRNALRQTLKALESTLEDVKCLKIMVDKRIDYTEVCDFETYQDYKINNFEYEFEKNNEYPFWWLEEDEFNLIKKVYGRLYY